MRDLSAALQAAPRGEATIPLLRGGVQPVQHFIHVGNKQGKPFQLKMSELCAADAGRRIGAEDECFCFGTLRFRGEVGFV